LSQLFGQLDTNKDKRISFPEFKKGHDLIGHSNISEQQLQHEFNKIDTNHGGYILFDEVCHFDLSLFNIYFIFSSAFIWRRKNYTK
jgi:Ca2+-binding EF-hand superfamily protein